MGVFSRLVFQGCFMRCVKLSGVVVVGLAVSLGCIIESQSVQGEELLNGKSTSLLSGLVGDADLKARTVKHERWDDGSRPIVSVKSLARQSVPDVDRASFYRLGEVFTHSKIAMPLLVVDLEPQGLMYVRPMSGRSVGAIPSAHWTRAVSIVEVASEGDR
jgi:hypothetical protein